MAWDIDDRVEIDKSGFRYTDKEENRMKRVILIVLDSVGIGNAPDAGEYGDEGSNTLLAASKSSFFHMPHMQKLGYFNIDGVTAAEHVTCPLGSFARLSELSKGKDTTIGHWEIAGVVSNKPLPTYPNGFPKEVLEEFSRQTGRGVLCNKPYSGTDVIRDYGQQHMETGNLIVYTSADSVFQIAAHEDVVPVDTLYEYCQMARKILIGEHGVGRVIARPFTGKPGNFVRTSRRHDFSLEPPETTMLDVLSSNGIQVHSIGKIIDIFAQRGIHQYVRTTGNEEGIDKTIEAIKNPFCGLLFVNLVDYDMLYGHRNDVDGYAKALTYFDECLPKIMDAMTEDDILMITADHGCDPSTSSTDHSRECIPLLMYGKQVTPGVNYGTLAGFNTIAATILHYFGIDGALEGHVLPITE